MGGNDELLERLFKAHSNDFASFDTKYPDHFVCPICYEIFPHEGINSGTLSVGHIWPDAIRKKSGAEIIKRQIVMLCKECNNNAGRRGDNQMQLREISKDEEKKGVLFGERRVEIIPGLPEKPIELHAQLKLNQGDEVQGKIVFTLDNAKKWARNNPKERDRFEALSKEKPFSMIVYPFHKIKPFLSEVGWITSAYLLAFYTFGYRYICNPDLNRVREYITHSFTDKPDPPPKDEDFKIQECSSHSFQEPQIGLVIPLDGKTPVHIEISLFDYHIRLPFHHYNQPILAVLIQRNEEISKNMEKLTNEGAKLFVKVDCTKMDSHDCIWDYVLGKLVH